jgi:hypothetical protein
MAVDGVLSHMQSGWRQILDMSPEAEAKYEKQKSSLRSPKINIGVAKDKT